MGCPVSRFDGVHDLDDVRECLSKLSYAFTDLLGNQPDRELAVRRLGELAGVAREIGVLCERRAAQLATGQGEER